MGCQKKIFAKVTKVELLTFVFHNNAGRSGILFLENSSNCLMQISLHRTRNTKQVMRGHNIVGDGWVGAASAWRSVPPPEPVAPSGVELLVVPASSAPDW